MIFYLFIILVLLISYRFIGYSLFRAFKNHDKRRVFGLSFVLIIMIVLPCVCLKILPGSDLFWQPFEERRERGHNYEITGLEFNVGPLIYEYESERAFNGDGYSIFIHEIDVKTADYFKNPNLEFFSKYPNRVFRSHWKAEHWKRTPFDNSEQQFFDFAYSSIEELNFELIDLLKEKGNYYAYEYYMHEYDGESVSAGNIDFYIICPYRKIIVMINKNT